MPESWTVKGSYLEACSCEPVCSCHSSGPPTEADCTVLLAWHLEEGRFGDVPLDGLNTVLSVYSPCHTPEARRTVALYVDERASGRQRDALAAIFTGQAGGHFAQVSQHIGEILGVRSASIEYRADGKRCSVRVGNLADSPDATPPSEEPGHEGQRRHWEISKENSFCSPFRYTNA
jgi:hypothetical protein